MGGVQSLVTDNATATAVVAAGVALVGAAAMTSKAPSTETTGSGGEKSEKDKAHSKGGALSASIPGQFEDTGVVDTPPEPKKAKAKKKAKTPKPVTEAAPSVVPIVVEPPAIVSVPVSEEPSSTSTASKKKKKSKKAKASTQPSTPLEHSVASVDTDSSWTRVEPKSRGSKPDLKSSSTRSATPTADNPTTTTGDEADEASGSDASEQDRPADTPRKPLAERLLPKARKTGVEDMLESPDVPTLARVVRVKPQQDEKPVDGFSWGDYEDVDTASRPTGDSSAVEDDDDGWGFVPVKSRGRKTTAAATTAAKPASAPTSTAEQSKKQRQNAAKRAAAKAAKDAAEQERLDLIAKHKKALERERMAAQQRTGKGKSSQLSGGQTASVDDKGRLVWE